MADISIRTRYPTALERCTGRDEAHSVRATRFLAAPDSGDTLRRAHAFGRKLSPEEIIRLRDRGVI